MGAESGFISCSRVSGSPIVVCFPTLGLFSIQNSFRVCCCIYRVTYTPRRAYLSHDRATSRPWSSCEGQCSTTETLVRSATTGITFALACPQRAKVRIGEANLWNRSISLDAVKANGNAVVRRPFLLASSLSYALQRCCFAGSFSGSSSSDAEALMVIRG